MHAYHNHFTIIKDNKHACSSFTKHDVKVVLITFEMQISPLQNTHTRISMTNHAVFLYIYYYSFTRMHHYMILFNKILRNHQPVEWFCRKHLEFPYTENNLEDKSTLFHEPQHVYMMANTFEQQTSEPTPNILNQSQTMPRKNSYRKKKVHTYHGWPKICHSTCNVT